MQEHVHIPTYHNCLIQGSSTGECLIMPFREYLQRHADMVFPHKHDFFHFVFFTKGTGSFTIDFETYSLVPGQMYFMAPEQVHEWHFDQAPEGFVVNFEAYLLDSFAPNVKTLQFQVFQPHAGSQVLYLSAPQQQWIHAQLQFLSPIAQQASPLKQELLASGLLQILYFTEQLQQKAWSGIAQQQIPVVLQQFKQLVEKHFKEKKLPKDYAALLPVSANQLNALCQHYFQKSAGTLIRERIILEAKRLLIDRKLTVAEIAYILQFQDPSYFTKFFKKLTQLTPESFRAPFIR